MDDTPPGQVAQERADDPVPAPTFSTDLLTSRRVTLSAVHCTVKGLAFQVPRTQREVPTLSELPRRQRQQLSPQQTQIFQEPGVLVAGLCRVGWNRMRPEAARRATYEGIVDLCIVPSGGRVTWRLHSPPAERALMPRRPQDSSSTPTAPHRGEWGPGVLAIKACHQGWYTPWVACGFTPAFVRSHPYR